MELLEFLLNLVLSEFLSTVLGLLFSKYSIQISSFVCFLIIPPLPEGGGGYTVLPLSVLPSVQDIFSRIFLSNYWWQKSDIWSQASYRYPISWEAFFDPSDSYFLFAEERGYHKWALAHSSSCLAIILYSEIWPYSSEISLIKMIPLFIQLTFTKHLPFYFIYFFPHIFCFLISLKLYGLLSPPPLYR